MARSSLLSPEEDPQRELDRWAKEQGYRLVIGVDEAGRGPWAGPVMAAAVILAGEVLGLKDSKKLSPQLRGRLRQEILEKSRAHALAEIPVTRIDEVNILQASLEAMSKAILGVLARCPEADCVLVDGLHAPPDLPIPCYCFAKADGRSHAVAAASILAKEARDERMRELDRLYPAYGFARHKGYGTALHQRALERHGPSPEHRRSFAPVKKLLAPKLIE